MEGKTYTRHYSHSHCWNQDKEPACGIPLKDHKQCCLCDTPAPSQEREWATELERFTNCCGGNYCPRDCTEERTAHLKSFIASEKSKSYEEGQINRNDDIDAAHEHGKEWERSRTIALLKGMMDTWIDADGGNGRTGWRAALTAAINALEKS